MSEIELRNALAFATGMLAGCVIGILICWTFFAIGNWEISPAEWSDNNRSLFSILSFFMSFVASTVIIMWAIESINKHEKQRNKQNLN